MTPHDLARRTNDRLDAEAARIEAATRVTQTAIALGLLAAFVAWIVFYP